MSNPVHIVSQIKLPNNSDNLTITTTTNISENIIRAEVESISVNSRSVTYKSEVMKNFTLRKSLTNLNFDDLQVEIDPEYLELKDYFIYKAIGDRKLYSSLCISDLSELNRKYDDSVKTKLYSAVILDNKEKIVQLKNNKIDFENVYRANSLFSKLEENLYYLCDELINVSECFEKEVIDNICTERANAEQIKKMQIFVSEILDKNNEPMMRNIGLNKDLKIKYIKLAYFLLNFKGFSNNMISYQGISQNLKNHLTRIISLRNTLVIYITEWIKFIVGDLFCFVHLLEGVEVDQNFLSNLQIEYTNQQAIVNNKVEHELIIKENSERISSLMIEINQLREQFTFIQNEYNILIEKNKVLVNQIADLSDMNSRLIYQNDELRNEQIKIITDIEAKYVVYIEKIKMEYDFKIEQYIIQIKEITKKKEELEVKYFLLLFKIILLKF
jgi:hypothetical protein